MNNFSPCSTCEKVFEGCKERASCKEYISYENKRQLVYEKRKEECSRRNRWWHRNYL